VLWASRVIVFALTMTFGVSIASDSVNASAGVADVSIPALTCPDLLAAAGVACPSPAVDSSPFVGAGGSAFVRGTAHARSRITDSSGPPSVSALPATNITCCSARLRATTTIAFAPNTGSVTDYFQLERDGGPQAVETVNATATLPRKPGTYLVHVDWSQLPSCSSYRYWLIAHDHYGTAIGGPRAFSTACPRKYIAWSIGQFYVGAPSSAPALGTIDTQPAAKALGGALGKLGYASNTLLGGQPPLAVLREAPAAAVLAVFDHADAGNFLTQGRGTNLCKTEGLVASGEYTFACAASRWLRLGALPAFDLWSVRLMIFGGCRTADTAPYYGNLSATAAALGVGSVIGFRDNVYFPGVAKNAGRSSGDYFWARFSTYVRHGDTIQTALRRAQGDLVRQSGRAWGYNSWVVSGAAGDPGALRLTIAGAHASTAHASAASAERDHHGDLVWYSAPARRTGARKLTAASARVVAARFLGTEAPRIAPGRMALISERPASHQQGELLESFDFRSLLDGLPGPAVAELEVDLRSGKVVYETAGQVVPTSTRFVVARATAVRAAMAAVGGGRAVSAAAELWTHPRWTVILHPDREPGVTVVVDVNAANGHVASINDADPS
jgi:hypothetical protein